jgi:hypothetical protein
LSDQRIALDPTIAGKKDHTNPLRNGWDMTQPRSVAISVVLTSQCMDYWGGVWKKCQNLGNHICPVRVFILDAVKAFRDSDEGAEGASGGCHCSVV